MSDIEVAFAEAQGTKSTQYPQLDLQLNARTGHDLGGTEGRDTSASALVVLNWNLYRGGADIARQREFVHRHQQAKESRTEAARSVENDVRQTWASMVSASERARQFAAQADANTDVVRAAIDSLGDIRYNTKKIVASLSALLLEKNDATSCGRS